MKSPELQAFSPLTGVMYEGIHVVRGGGLLHIGQVTKGIGVHMHLSTKHARTHKTHMHTQTHIYLGSTQLHIKPLCV